MLMTLKNTARQQTITENSWKNKEIEKRNDRFFLEITDFFL